MGINVSIGAGGDLLPGYKMDEVLSPSLGGITRTYPCLETLCRVTMFTKAELQTLYRGFKQECPLGFIDESAFSNIFSRFFPLGDPSQYASLVFNLFDASSCGTITFQELATNLSLLSRGTSEEKLNWVFGLYDRDKDGYISLADLTHVLTSIYHILDANTKHNFILIKGSYASNRKVNSNAHSDKNAKVYFQKVSPTPKNPSFKRRYSLLTRQSQEQNCMPAVVSHHADVVFQRMDSKGDGVVDKEEFLEFCMKDISTMQAIESLGTNFYFS